MTRSKVQSQIAMMVLIASLAVIAPRRGYGQQPGAGDSGSNPVKINVSTRLSPSGEMPSPDFIGFGWFTVQVGLFYAGPCPLPFWWGDCVCLGSCTLDCLPVGTLFAPPPIEFLVPGTPVTLWGGLQTTTVSGEAEIVVELIRKGKAMGTWKGTAPVPASSESLVSISNLPVPNSPGPVELKMTATIGTTTVKSSQSLIIE
jgi:hypothetical protein